MTQRFMRIAATVNFLAVLGAATFWYSSCRTSANQPLPRQTGEGTTIAETVGTPGHVASTITAAAQPPASPSLTSFQAIAACLDHHGGVVRGACVSPATVEGIEIGARPNDQYFAASKAAPAISWSSGKDAIKAIQDICYSEQAATGVKPNADLACVLAYLQARTTAAATQ